MITRRDFLGASAVAVGAAGMPPQQAFAEPLPPLDVLPPSIDALRSRQDEPVPISNDERRARIEKARRLMREHGIDAVMLTGGTSLVYYTNIRWGLSERLLGIVIPASGSPFMVTPQFEEERAREQIAMGPLADAGVDVMTWEEDESPSRLVADGLRSRGLVNGTLGIEETVRFVFSNDVTSAAPGLTLTSATPVTAGCRGRKDEHEIALMRLASEVTLEAYEAAYHALEEGMTQGDFARLVSEAHTKLGYSGGAGVQTGEYSALPHGSTTRQVIREGTILLIDGGCGVEGYRSASWKSSSGFLTRNSSGFFRR